MKRLATVAALVLVGLLMWAGPALIAADPPAASPVAAVLIRPVYKEGMQLNYRWNLSDKTGWIPAQDGTDWVGAQTDFSFTLVGKTLRDDGSMTWLIKGDSLKASGESNKGKIGVEATPTQAKLLVNKEWLGPSENTPLKHEMTLTLGKRFDPLYGTGLEHIGLYFLPNVNRGWWYLVSTAPIAAVSPGQSGQTEFLWPLPGMSAKPVTVKGTWKVGARRIYKGQNVIPIELDAKLELADTPAVLPNGDKVNLKHAIYEAKGLALWHAENGILCFAEAQEKFDASAAAPDVRRLGHIASSKLELLSAK